MICCVVIVPRRAFRWGAVVVDRDLQQLAPVVKEDEWALLKQHYASAFFFHSKALAATRTWQSS